MAAQSLVAVDPEDGVTGLVRGAAGGFWVHLISLR